MITNWTILVPVPTVDCAGVDAIVDSDEDDGTDELTDHTTEAALTACTEAVKVNFDSVLLLRGIWERSTVITGAVVL